MCEITGVILSQTLLDHSLVTEKQKKKTQERVQYFGKHAYFLSRKQLAERIVTTLLSV